MTKHTAFLTAVLFAHAAGCATDFETGSDLQAVRAPSDTTSTVYPTGDPATDLANLQDAVDRGGVVLLKSTDREGRPAAFQLGGAIEDSIQIERGVVLRGERTGAGSTTVRGGLVPFAIATSEPVRIETLALHQPELGGIHITGEVDAELHDLEITDVIGVVVLSLGLSEGRAIKALHIDGRLSVTDCRIRGQRADLTAAVFVYGARGEVEIARNQIEETGEGIISFGSTASLRIVDNVITPGRLSGVWGNGISLAGTSNVLVTRNRLVIDNPNADGIVVLGGEFWGGDVEGTVIVGNRVEMGDSLFGAITLIDNVSASYIGQNIITGRAAYGFGVFPTGLVDGAEAADNAVVGTNFTGFESRFFADVLLLWNAARTTVVGPHGTVLDLGLDSTITGLSPVAGDLADREIRRPKAFASMIAGD